MRLWGGGSGGNWCSETHQGGSKSLPLWRRELGPQQTELHRHLPWTQQRQFKGLHRYTLNSAKTHMHEIIHCSFVYHCKVLKPSWGPSHRRVVWIQDVAHGVHGGAAIKNGGGRSLWPAKEWFLGYAVKWRNRNESSWVPAASLFQCEKEQKIRKRAFMGSK